MEIRAYATRLYVEVKCSFLRSSLRTLGRILCSIGVSDQSVDFCLHRCRHLRSSAPADLFSLFY